MIADSGESCEFCDRANQSTECRKKDQQRLEQLCPGIDSAANELNEDGEAGKNRYMNNMLGQGHDLWTPH